MAKRQNSKTRTAHTRIKKGESPPTVDLPAPGDVVDVTGIFRCPSSWDHDSESGRWNLHTSFLKCKRTGGDIIDGDVRIIERKLTWAMLNKRLTLYRSYKVFRLKLKFETTSDAGLTGTLLKSKGESQDREFQKLAKELKRPIVYEDARLGVFEIDRASHLWEGRVPWIDGDVGLTLEVNNPEDFRTCLAPFRAIHRRKKTFDKQAKQFAAHRLLDLGNDWLDDGGQDTINAATFRKRLTLESMDIKASGDCEFWYDAGGIFTEHGVTVYGNVSGEFESAKMQ